MTSMPLSQLSSAIIGKAAHMYGSLSAATETGTGTEESLGFYLAEKGVCAPGFAKKKFSELAHFVDEGHWSWSAAGLVAGALIAYISFLSFWSHVLTLSWFSALVDIYIFCAGILATLLEFKHRVFTQQYLDIIRSEARFLYRPYGRAGFYFFVGLLLVETDGWLGFVGGIYASFVGLVIFLSSQRSMQRLNVLRNNINNETELANTFQRFDTDQSGYLESEELGALCAILGASLTPNELDSALMMLDTNHDGKIAFNEFSEWWRGKQENFI